jgi:iron complex outermembrane receptor protein
MADFSKKHANFKEEHVRSRIRSNLITAGFPTMKVDEVMGNIDRLPDSLVQSCYEMVIEDLKERLSTDPDYQNKKGLELNWGLAANQYIGDHFGEIIWARYASQSDLRERYYENQGIKSEVNSYVRGNYQKGPWNFYGEMHYRFIDYRFEGLAVVNEIPTVTDQIVQFNFLNPKAGLSYKINNSQSLYFSYAKANREPVRDDFTESSQNSRPRPEQLHNVESAYLLQKRRLTLRTTAYFMYYIDQLVLNGQINDVGGFTRTNVDESYRLGLEIEAGFKVNKKLQINATAALSRNKIMVFNEFVDSYSDDPDFYEQVLTRYTNTDISFSPNAILGGKITYTPIENLELVVIGKYVGQQYLDNTQNPLRTIDAFAYGNFRANYIIKDWLFKEIHLGILVNNFTNALFESNGYTFSYLYNNELTTENYFYPQAGTNFLLNLKLMF